MRRTDQEGALAGRTTGWRHLDFAGILYEKLLFVRICNLTPEFWHFWHFACFRNYRYLTTYPVENSFDSRRLHH